MTHVGLLLTTLTPGHVGGSETYVRGLLAAFAAGHGPQRTTVLAHAPTAAALGDLVGGAATTLHELRGGGPPAAGPARAAWLTAALLSSRAGPRARAPTVDVIHAPLTIPVPRLDAPLVVTLHDVVHHEHPASFSAAERAFRRVAYDAPARRAAFVVTVSEHARSAIVERLGIGPDRVVAIHHGIDHARLRPARDDADADAARLASLALPERFVVYPANLWPHKNHERLLEALARCADRELAIVFTGRAGPRLRALGRLAARLRIEARVRHLGYLPAAALPALYRSALGLVFPSLCEGFGAPPLEAMACGCPVAASSTGAVAEVTAGAALHFDPTDVDAIAAVLDRLATDASLRGRLRADGIAHAARFRWTASARRHAGVYERACASG